MSELAKTARKDAKEKIDRMLMSDPHAKVDASSWTPAEALNADVQTGPRPVSRQPFKHGGGVKVIDGMHVRRGDRKPRANGGNAMATPNNLQNRDLKEANELRNGTKHDGGFKKGGSVHADAAEDKKLIRKMMHDGDCKCGKCSGGRAERASGGSLDGTFQGTRPIGGRLAKASGGLNTSDYDDYNSSPKNIKDSVSKIPSTTHKFENGKMVPPTRYDIYDRHTGNVVGKATSRNGATRSVDRRDNQYGGYRHSAVPVYEREGRKSGGKAGKGKMNVNIIIAAGKGQDQMPAAAPMPMPPPGGPVGLRQGVPPPPPMMPPGGAPPGAPMARRSGGRTYEAGAGSGLGRLEKVKNYGGA